MKLSRFLLVLLLAVVLPIQGVAGVSMSMCGSSMGVPQPMPQDAMSHETMSSESIAATCHHAGDALMDEAASSSLFDSCPHCFALAHFIVAPSMNFPRQHLPSVELTQHAPLFVSRLTTPPLRPPLFI